MTMVDLQPENIEESIDRMWHVRMARMARIE
jgi:hypothetical protein